MFMQLLFISERSTFISCGHRRVQMPCEIRASGFTSCASLSVISPGKLSTLCIGSFEENYHIRSREASRSDFQIHCVHRSNLHILLRQDFLPRGPKHRVKNNFTCMSDLPASAVQDMSNKWAKTFHSWQTCALVHQFI